MFVRVSNDRFSIRARSGVSKPHEVTGLALTFHKISTTLDILLMVLGNCHANNMIQILMSRFCVQANVSQKRCASGYHIIIASIFSHVPCFVGCSWIMFPCFVMQLNYFFQSTTIQGVYNHVLLM